MKRLLAICILFLMGATVFSQSWLSTNYPKAVLEKIIPAPKQYTPIPAAKDVFWKNTIPLVMRNEYITMGEKYLGAKWEKLPDALFAEYKTNGNRSNYENKNFELRRQLSFLAMAEIMEHQGRFMKDILRGLHYFIEEPWWGIPAHYPVAKPERSRQVVDLFNAETANLIVWTTYMLQDELEGTEKGICRKINKEIDRRILTPAFNTNYSWKTSVSNWNTWICSNWLSCVLFCESDRQKQIEAIAQILKCLDIFMDGYPEDGGCDEGVQYWDRAMGALYECFQLLAFASDGQITLPDSEKIKAMGAFIYKMYIGNGYYVNFADCHSKNLPNINILYPLGVALNDKAMRQHAAFIAKQHDYTRHPLRLFRQSGNFPTVSRELCFLHLMESFGKEQPQEAQVPFSWLSEREIFCARNNNGLYVAAKGGHNNESHNHNDVGNFIIYANNAPLLIDLGNDTYTAKTFSKERYTLMNTRSAYHNVPLINGQEQQAGRTFQCTQTKVVEKTKSRCFSLDIAKAYPPTAQVQSWLRSIELSEKGVIITEDYSLASNTIPIELIFMTPVKPQQSITGKISFVLDNHQYDLRYPDGKIEAKVENIDISKSALKNAWSTPALYKIRLSVKSKKRKNKVSYSIIPSN